MKESTAVSAVGKSMGRGHRDLTGQRFGKLIAETCAGRTAGRHWVWSCVCDCGNKVAIHRAGLVSGRRTSCGCDRYALVAGQSIGRLTLVRELQLPNGPGWECACVCGGAARYRSSDLARGRRASCRRCSAARAERGVARCSVCRSEKPLTEFHGREGKPTGKSYACKACTNEKTAAAYRKNINASRARRREYFAKDPRGTARLIENRKRNPAKNAAQTRVYNAVKRGDLVRPSVCSRCPETHRIEGHHDDYGKPLEVMWLCTACHRARHKELRELGIDPEASTRPNLERKSA